MPGKRKRRVSPTTQGLAPGAPLKRQALAKFSSWGWVGTEVVHSSKINSKHLLATCNLLKSNHNPFCVNKFNPSIKEAKSSRSSMQKENALDESEPEVIVISDDEESMCGKTSCKGNPNCLNYLGQEIWENDEKAVELFEKAAELGDNPLLESREPDLPVGLKNLGATCYANASLQVWFRDLAFRAGVYDCQPLDGLEDRFEESPIFQLQVTFAALQESIQNVYNPSKLVESLQLRTFEQQDAQEFSKLFMSHLDTEFKKQSKSSVQSLIMDQFQGKQAYVTICSVCHYRSEKTTDFLEIEINFGSNSDIEDRISALLQQENLSGDNRYFCPQCDCLRDAARYTELRKLPPVLHLSLLRFVYDITSMERRKSKHSISFPSMLDMNHFLGSTQSRADFCSKEENVYELRGVLLHKGASAYHGHYEAQVYDSMTQSCFLFNDEIVTKMKALGDRLLPKKMASDINGENPQMGFKNGVHAKKRRKFCDSDDEIKEIIAQPNEGPPIKDNNNNITFSSRDAYMLIYARRDTSQTLNSSQPTLFPPYRALEVVGALNREHEGACQAYEERKIVLQTCFEDLRMKIREIYHTWDVTSEATESIITSQQALISWLSTHCIRNSLPPGIRIDEVDSLKTSNEESLQVISAGDIICAHRMLDPNKARDMKRISQAAYHKIVEYTRCQFEPVFKPADVCPICVETIFQERLYELEHPRLVQNFENIRTVAEGIKGYWISKKWLRDWKLNKPKMHVPTQNDPSPDAEEYDSDVRCEHGNLSINTIGRRKISEQAGQLLQSLFPAWEPLSSDFEACIICRNLLQTSKEDKKEIRKRTEEEKAKLRSLLDDFWDMTVDEQDQIFFAIVPSLFLKSWKQWINNPNERARPVAVDNTPFICDHDKLIFDPNCPADMDSTISVIERSDWDTLKTLYPCGPPIILEKRLQEDGNVRYLHDVSVCVHCRLRRKSDWTTTEIVVYLRGSNTGARQVPLKPSITYSSKHNPRQSRRLRQNRQNGENRRLTILKTTSVKDIKMMIQEEFNIPTICQRLSYLGTELGDNTATMESLKILANETLELLQEVEVVNIDSDSDGSPTFKKQREGEGFGGTLLASIHRLPSRSPEDIMEYSPQEKTCSACTFRNAYNALTCTMCDTTFV